MSRDVTLRHTGQDVESYLINTVSAAADGLIGTLLISIVAELSRSPSCRQEIYWCVECALPPNHIHISLIN